ncbi:MAG: hypothetical protein L3J42_06695 [Hydrogenimonas sp.]|nr:hypothetical protein [Hydrogenimonas sp.]
MKKWSPLALIAVAVLAYAENCPTPKVEKSTVEERKTSVTTRVYDASSNPKVTKIETLSKEEAPTLTKNNTIYFQVVGQGVAPVNTVSPAQALALAKRAAIADAYRQLGEKIYGVRVEGRDLIRDMMISRSTVRTHIDAIIKDAKILDTKFKDGLCEVEMEISLNGKEWYARLSR